MAREKCADAVGMRLLVGDGLEKDAKVTEELMEKLGQGYSIPRPVNLCSFDKVGNARVKHVKNGKSGLPRGILDHCVSNHRYLWGGSVPTERRD